MNTRHSIAETIGDAHDSVTTALFTECEAAAVDTDQGWDGESTRYKFADGSGL